MNLVYLDDKACFASTTRITAVSWSAARAGKMGEMVRASGWVRVTRQTPCAVCGKGDWCRVSADGAVAGCMRTKAGSFHAKTGSDGSTVYLDRLADGPRPHMQMADRFGAQAKRAGTP